MINKLFSGLVRSSVSKTCFSVITIERYYMAKVVWCFKSCLSTFQYVSVRFNNNKHTLAWIYNYLRNSRFRKISEKYHLVVKLRSSRTDANSWNPQRRGEDNADFKGTNCLLPIR